MLVKISTKDNAEINDQIECIHLNLVIECATNRSIYDNSKCEFDETKCVIGYSLKRFLKDDKFGSCGVKPEYVDKLLDDKLSFSQVYLIVSHVGVIIGFAIFFIFKKYKKFVQNQEEHQLNYDKLEQNNHLFSRDKGSQGSLQSGLNARQRRKKIYYPCKLI